MSGPSTPHGTPHGIPPAPQSRPGPPRGPAAGRRRVVALVLAICVPVGSAIGVGAAFLVDNLGTGTDTTASPHDQSDTGEQGADDQGNGDQGTRSGDSGKNYEPEERDTDGPMSASDWESFGTCGLLATEDLRWTAPTNDADLPVRPILRRVVQRPGGNERRESCQYAATAESIAGDLRVIVSQWRPEVDEEAATEKAPGLGDGAVFLGQERGVLLVPHGDLHLALDGPSPKQDGRTQSDIRDSLVETAKAALDRLPEKVTFPARVESQLCADIDQQAVTDTLGTEIGLSRSLHSELAQTCTFLSTTEGEKEDPTRLEITVNPDPSYSSILQLGRGSDESLDILEGVDAYWSSLGLVLRGTGRTVRLQYYPDGGIYGGMDELPPPPEELVAVARSVAEVHDLGSPGRRKPADDGPCALLTPEEAGPFGYEKTLPPKARYVDAAGRVPADTCAYDDSAVGRLSSPPPLLVQTSAEHFDPVRSEYQEVIRDPIDDLGDEAYLINEGSDAAAVVRRGKHQLTLRPRSFEPTDPSARELLREVARRANERWEPGGVAAKQASGPCAEIGPEKIGDAVGTDVTHVRELALRPDHRCAYTTTSGEVLLVTPHQRMGLGERSLAIDEGEAVDGLHAFARSEKLMVLDKATSAGVRVALWTPVEDGFEEARVSERHTKVGKLFSEAFFEG